MRVSALCSQDATESPQGVYIEDDADCESENRMGQKAVREMVRAGRGDGEWDDQRMFICYKNYGAM